MKKMKRFLGILLSFALVLVMMSGLGVTANAVDSPYAGLKNTTNVVHFDGKDWYLIDYDDSTVTLLAKECIGASQYSFASSYVEYDQSKVKEVVDHYYTNEFSAAAKTAINGNKMFLLTDQQAHTIYNANPDVLKCSPADGAEGNFWWLCTQGDFTFTAACVDCVGGYGSASGEHVLRTLGVRPALKLNLSSVIFSSSSGTNTFTVTDDTDDTSDTGITLPETVYVTGTFNDWTTGSSDYAMTKEGNVCTITVKGVEAGDHVFKFCGTDWAEFDYGLDENLNVHSSTGVEVGRFYAARQGGANIRFTFTEKSDVTVIFDASGATPRFMIGDIKPSNSTGSSHGHSHHICEDGHKFAYCVMQAPTTEVDGFAEWRCIQCGIYDWNDHDNADARETVTLSAYPVFNDTLENNIKAAEAGATVSIETKRWVSVRRGVLEALVQKPGVTLSIKFAKDGTDYVLTIPGGDPALAGILATEDHFFNFMALGNTYGLTAVEK